MAGSSMDHETSTSIARPLRSRSPSLRRTRALVKPVCPEPVLASTVPRDVEDAPMKPDPEVGNPVGVTERVGPDLS
eukprot:3427020-Heterocapsa_arctica.AAC.1